MLEGSKTKAAEDETQERREGLEDTMALISKELEREETRAEQIEYLTKLQKLKKWARKNLASQSPAVIAVVGIITTVVVGARKAVLQGAQATSKFAKAVAKLAKKYGL